MSPWMTTFGWWLCRAINWVTVVASSSTKYWHARISASILSEQLGRQTARTARTRERPFSIADDVSCPPYSFVSEAAAIELTDDLDR